MVRESYLPFGRPNFSDEEIEAAGRVMRGGWIGMGPETVAFEKELQDYLGAPYVVTVDTCTSALFLALLAHGIAPGDEVICPSLTWCSTANAALYLGARVVFCDVDPQTLCLTPETVRAKISSRTKAVMAVHFGGLAADTHVLRDCLPEGIHLVEDAAHALGARYPNRQRVGTSGCLACFSFYANKNLSTGEGGAIALFDKGQAEKLRSLRQHGMASHAWTRYIQPSALDLVHLTELGYKMNYTDLQAAIGRVQLRRQDAFAQTRLAIAQHYARAIAEKFPQIEFQKDCLEAHHARHLFVILLPQGVTENKRDQMVLNMRAKNIGASVHYPPLHRMRLYGYNESLPVTEDVFRRIITLPISASMTLNDAQDVLDALEAELL